jgi:hypothetical protein
MIDWKESIQFSSFIRVTHMESTIDYSQLVMHYDNLLYFRPIIIVLVGIGQRTTIADIETSIIWQ